MKSILTKQKEELWKWFSKYIRLRDKGICFTCGRYAEGSGYHAGHFVPAAVGGLLLRYDERNVHGQCYHCNINLGGWGERYAQRMEEKYGKKVVAELRANIGKVVHNSQFPFLEKTLYYRNIVSGLESSAVPNE